jgi:hypothetical protein
MTLIEQLAFNRRHILGSRDMRTSIIVYALLLCALVYASASCGGQSSQLLKTPGEGVSAAKSASMTMDNLEYAWPQAGNLASNQSYQGINTNGGFLNNLTFTTEAQANNISQPVTSTHFQAYVAANSGTIYCIDYDGVGTDTSWSYTPAYADDSFAVTPAWFDPDPNVNDDEVVYHVYYTTYGTAQMCALNANTGTLLWTSGTLGYEMLRSSPKVTAAYVYITEVANGIALLHVYDRASGAFLAGATINSSPPGDPPYNSCTVAVGSQGYVYMLISDTTNSKLYKLLYAGGAVNFIDQTAWLPGKIVTNDTTVYDTQHGPVVYMNGRNEYVAFALADVISAGGGVYGYPTANLATPAWTHGAGQNDPMYHSGVAADAAGNVYFYERALQTDYNTSLDVYGGYIYKLNGSNGTQLWISALVAGRLGSVPSVSADGYLYGQIRLFWVHYVKYYNTNLANDAGTDIATSTTAGNGPVTISEYVQIIIKGTTAIVWFKPAILYIDSIGRMQIWH